MNVCSDVVLIIIITHKRDFMVFQNQIYLSIIYFYSVSLIN